MCRIWSNIHSHAYRLDFDATFYFNRRVSAGNRVTSLISVSEGGKNSAIAFTTTQWSVVVTAQGASPAAQEALEKLCRRYWRPLYGFVRRQGHGPEEAEDLTQGFFAQLLERRDLDVVRREKGRLRSYLLVSLKHFLANERHRARAIKRGGGRSLIPLEELQTAERATSEPTDNLTADLIYEQQWALRVLEQVLVRLREERRAAGDMVLFEQLEKLLADEPDRPSLAETAARLAMNENAVKQAIHRLRERYRQILREEIAQTVTAPGDVEDELRHLISVLRT
jgi:RNA polymerase sigma factor (sigma-70 family)